MLVNIRRAARSIFWSALMVTSAPFAGTDAAFAQAPGGFTESATGNGLRPRLSAGEIQTFLPSRGRFTFPAPYGSVVNGLVRRRVSPSAWRRASSVFSVPKFERCMSKE